MLKPITLFGEQKKVLFLSPTDPIQIKGVAGSGKTTVSLYRAKHLLETQSNLFQASQVAIFSFSTTLVAYIDAVKSHISGGYQKDSDEIVVRSVPGLNISVVNFHKWAYWFLKKRGLEAFIDIKQLKNFQIPIVQEIISELRVGNLNSSILSKRSEFYLEEISWIKGKLFNNKNEYIQSKRIGRGTSDRVTVENKEILWRLYEMYDQRMKVLGMIDFDDYAIMVIEEIIKDRSFNPPFTHIVIDEAQDLTKAQMIAISMIVSKQTNSLTIIADAAQRIYKNGFTWTEVGIELRGGRTLSLKKNYRNTEAILLAANSLLNHDPDPAEFTEAESARKGGKKPQVCYFKSYNSQDIFLINEIRKIDKLMSDIVILHRDWNGMRRASELLNTYGIDNEIINQNSAINFENNRVKICTLSSIKGLEFDFVFIIDLNDEIIPYPNGFNEENDEVHISTERRLLYTAMTRAKEELFLLCSGFPSRYLSEIDEQLINIFKDSSTPNLIDNTDDLPF